MALVTFTNVKREYSGQEVLRGASFEISVGQKLGLIGMNGCGKTTLLRIMCGQEKAQEGTVSLASDLRIGYARTSTSNQKYSLENQIEKTILFNTIAISDQIKLLN
mgnify:CR=1 FL=1